MNENYVYRATAKGEVELRNSMTGLLPDEIGLLVRIDGLLTLGQIKASWPEISQAAFAEVFNRLLDRCYVVLVEADPFAEQIQFQLNQMALTLAGAEADAGTASLKKSGYYVSIARKQVRASTLRPGGALRAVVVEDEFLLAKFIESYLSLEGFQVRLAGNRTEVVAELRKQPVPDLILLDVMLPDADGFDILLRLRQHAALKEVPVIMLTAMTTREAVLKGLASGADGYITKPFEADALFRAVRTVLGLPDNASAAGKSRDPWTNRDALS